MKMHVDPPSQVDEAKEPIAGSNTAGKNNPRSRRRKRNKDRSKPAATAPCMEAAERDAASVRQAPLFAEEALAPAAPVEQAPASAAMLAVGSEVAEFSAAEAAHADGAVVAVVSRKVASESLQPPAAGGDGPSASAAPRLADAGGVSQYGQRLQAARERAGWTREEVATRLRLPLRLIVRLESDDYVGLTQEVFLRGYLESYAKLLGLPLAEAAQVAEAHAVAVPLVATGTISRSRRLWDRYAVSATYLVLTAIIVVPAVWLAARGGLDQQFAQTTPLDPPAALVSESAAALNEASAGGPSAPSGQPLPLAVHEGARLELEPLTASMTPFVPALTSPPDSTQAAGTVGEAATRGSGQVVVHGSGEHELVLKLAKRSWVEVSDAAGNRLQYDMLEAGSERSYRSSGALLLRLGNAEGASITSDGEAVDIVPFQRGNVAYIEFFGAAGAPIRPHQ